MYMIKITMCEEYINPGLEVVASCLIEDSPTS